MKRLITPTFLCAVLLSLLLTGCWLLITPRLTPANPDFAQNWDHLRYIDMARGGNTEAPYAYRVLTPFLARLMPFDLTTNFSLITFLSLWGTGVAVYALALAFDFTPIIALLGCVLFYSLYWATGFVIWDFWLCDPLLFLLIALAIRAAKLKQARRFAVFLAIGILDKEAMLCVMPLWFTFNPSLWKHGLVLTAVAFLVFVGLRIAVPTKPYDYNLLESLRVEITARAQTFGLSTLRTWTFGVFGLLAALPFLTRRNLVHAARFAPFLLLIYAQLLVASDTERLLVIAFPAVIIMSLETVRRYVSKSYGLIQTRTIVGDNT